MDPQPYLRCLGQPALFAPTGEPIRLKANKHLGLIVYLAVDAGRPQRRDWLAECFWPKASPSEARHSLSTALSALRPRLGQGILEAGRDHIRLQPGRIALDLDRLLAGDVLGGQMTGPLEVAAFLDGFDLVDSIEFMQWKDRQQARLLPAIKQALVILMDQRRRMGDFHGIEQFADRMLALDDLSEEAIRAKMEARAFAGDRITGLRLFEDWKAKLSTELQAVPSELLDGIAFRLRRRGWERAIAPDVPIVRTDQWQGRTFIGRAVEYQRLYEAWDATRKGPPSHVLVLGDSGVGKTTLVERLTTAAGLEGAAVSRVQCYDLDREIPYAAVSTLILGLLDHPAVSGTPPEALAELAHTVPEIRRRFPAIPPFADSQGEAARVRLVEAFLELLLAITEEHPVILIVDDLHLADDASLAVLQLVIRRTREKPIMVLFLTRPGELGQSPHAARLRENAKKLGLREVEVTPLPEKESRDLLKALIPTDQSRPTVSIQRTLVRAAAGYPMVLELLVQDWLASRDQSLALSVDAMTTELANDGTAVPAYRQLLQRITQSLTPATQNVLNLAAILGHRTNDFSMYGLVDLSLGQVVAGMTELTNLRVLRDGEQGLEFVNELIRGAVYLAIPSVARRVLHSHVADRLMDQERNGTADLGLEIAWHCIRGGRQEEAVTPLMRGAREAMRRGAPHNAERALSTALSILTEPQRTEAILLLAEALQEQCRWQDSLAALEQLPSSLEPHAVDLAYVFRLKAQRLLGCYGIDNVDDVLSELTQFIRAPRDRHSRVLAAVEAASILNGLHLQTATPEVVDALTITPELADALVDIREIELDTDDHSHLLLARAMLSYKLKNFEAGVQEIQTAIELLHKHQASNSVLAMLYCGLGAIHSARAKYAHAVRQHLQGADMALRIGNERVYSLAAGNLALAYSYLGEYENATAWAEISLGGHHDFQHTGVQGALISHAMRGYSEAVDEIIARYTSRLGNHHPSGVWQSWYLHCADSYMLLGRTKEGEHAARRATTVEYHDLMLDFYAGNYARWIATLGHIDGRHTEALCRLNHLMGRLPQFDALDQVEILVATSWLEVRVGMVQEARVDEVKQRLNALPPAVANHLARMGMLDHI